MRTLLATLLTAFAVLVVVPAHAGGPTSVLVTNPEDARATALYYSDEQYADLDVALHGSSAEREEPEGSPAFYNLTWLIHDVSIWRTEQVAVSGEGVWVSSTDVMNGGDASPWREAADPEAVRAILEEIGMTGPGSPSVSQGSAGAPTVAEEPSAAEPVVVTETQWYSLAGWRWAVPGVLAGVLLTALLLGRSKGLAGPRQLLVDEEPARAPAQVRVPG